MERRNCALRHGILLFWQTGSQHAQESLICEAAVLLLDQNETRKSGKGNVLNVAVDHRHLRINPTTSNYLKRIHRRIVR